MVVPLYGIGEAENGRLFYYMRFIDGETMDEAIQRFHRNRPRRGGFAEQSVEFRRLLTSFVSVCKTIAYAHNRGIVHRDIKPANVMLGRYGETVVVDWGLAVPVAREKEFRASGEATLRPISGSSGTASGAGAGTLAYMSPEQASNLTPTPASDIYSLGATLYKLLTGQPSVAGENVTEIKAQIIDGRIVPPKQRLASVPGSLESICLHAMALHPKDRYPTALALAEDIENYLADAKVTVFDEPWTRRAARWARKHRLAAQAILGAALAVLAVTVASALWLGRLAKLARDAEQQATAHQLSAEVARDNADAARQKNLELSARFFAESLADKIDKRWRVLETLQTSPRLRELMALLAGGENEAAQSQLQAWLTDRRQVFDVFKIKSGPDRSAWIIFDRKGRMLARSPGAQTIGETFSHRDYFHGYGRDLFATDLEILRGRDLGEIEPFEFVLARLRDYEHVHAAHVSAVFQSRSTQTLMVCFTVPIWDQPAEAFNRSVIGVLSIGVEISDFELPSNVMVFQVKEDQMLHRAGMVISHRTLRSYTKDDPPPYVPEEIVSRARELSTVRLRFPNEVASLSSFLPDFVDPVIKKNTGEERRCAAAFEPVIVRSRPDSIADTGWTVVVMEEIDVEGRSRDRT